MLGMQLRVYKIKGYFQEIVYITALSDLHVF